MKRIGLIAVALLLSAPIAAQIGGGGVSYVPLANVYSSASILRARDYNILPNNTTAQNDAGFTSLKAAMLAQPSITWRVVFEPGAYTYTNNRWLFGVQKVILEAYDSTFQSVTTDANYGNGIPLFNGDAFDDSGDAPWPLTTYANGYLFNTAVAGATSVTTTTHADAGNFTPGMRVLLSGYDQQQGGYPPNLRYFDYKTVLTANASTGVITFTDSLQNSYDSRWWDTANYAGTGVAFGAPRILSLERTNYKKAQLIWIKGATFLANPTAPDNTPLQLTGDLVIYEDVTARYYTVESTTTQLMHRCKALSVRPGDQSSADKLVDHLIIEDSLFDVGNSGATPAFVNGAGANSIALIRSKFYGSIKPVSPRSLFISDSDVIPLVSDSVGIATASLFPTRAITIENTRVYNTGGLTNGFTNTASPGGSLTVGSVVGTDIRVSFDATGKTVADSIEYGMTLTNTVTGNTGTITAIYYETGSPGTLRIAGTWTAPTAADVFNFYDVMNLNDGGGNVIVGTQVPFFRSPPGPTVKTGVTLSGTPTVADVLAFQTNGGSNASRVLFTANSSGVQINSNNGGTPIALLSGSVLGMSNGSTLTAASFTANTADIADSQGTSVVNIGIGTTTGQITIGGGSDPVVINSSASGAMNGVTIGATTPKPATITTLTINGAVTAAGTKFTASGCSNSTTVGGATAGKFTSGTTGTCTVTITLPASANGWACHADDLTTPANFIGQSASTTTSCTVQGTTVSGDILVFSAMGF